MEEMLRSQREITILQEISLGQHHLVLMSDQSIDLIAQQARPCIAEIVLHIEQCEAYRLMVSLQEMFHWTPPQ